MNNKGRWQKLLLMHKASFCEFKIQFKFDMEDKLWWKGGRNTDILIKSEFFYLKSSQVRVFCSNFSRFRMFWNDDHSKLVPESTHSGVSHEFYIVRNLHENPRSEDLIIELKVETSVITLTRGSYPWK